MELSTMFPRSAAVCASKTPTSTLPIGTLVLRLADGSFRPSLDPNDKAFTGGQPLPFPQAFRTIAVGLTDDEVALLEAVVERWGAARADGRTRWNPAAVAEAIADRRAAHQKLKAAQRVLDDVAATLSGERT